MRNYVYKLKDESGKTLYGFSEAHNKKDLKKRLRHSSFFFISAELYDRKKIFGSKVDLEALLVFTRRLSSLIEAGIPILTAMHILWRQTEDKTIQLVISHIRNRLEEGRKISIALDDFPKMFPPMYRAMISVAEKAGGLVVILKRLTKYLEYQKLFITRTKKATLYPAIVAIFAFLVLIGMFVVVVPRFQVVLEQLHVELPFITRAVLGMSEMMRSPIFMIGAFLFLVIIISVYKVFKHDPKFAQTVDYYKLKIPFVGNILYSLALGRFVRSLSILAGAGLPIVESFEVAKTTTSNQYIVGGINQAQKKIERGQSLYESFKEAKLFPVMFVEMVGVGESSGAIVQSLENLADHFDEEVEYKQNKFFTLLEPILILSVGIIVIITLLAIYMPIFSLWQGLLG